MTDNQDGQDGEEKPKLLAFPCDFPLKVISRADSSLTFSLEEFTTMVVHKHSPHMEYIPVSKNTSHKGNYQAVTVTIKAISQTQLDAIYNDLTANKFIIMVL